VEGLLAHPYLTVSFRSREIYEADFQAYHDPSDEPTAAPLKRNFFDFEDYKENLPKEMLKREVLSSTSTSSADIQVCYSPRSKNRSYNFPILFRFTHSIHSCIPYHTMHCW
jgi:hypothetical protein